MAYNISITYLPSGSNFYVHGAENNPTSIEAGSSATLNFIADGTYFVLFKSQASAVSVTGATISSWSCQSPFTNGTLIITNPVSDVSITITSKIMVNPLTFNRPFNINAKAPIDIRTVLSKAQMREISDSKQPDVYYCVCSDDKKFYLYDSNLTSNADTGKFKLMFELDESTIATEDKPGTVKSSSENDSVTINSDGTMSINDVTVDKLVNSPTNTLVLDGGTI